MAEKVGDFFYELFAKTDTKGADSLLDKIGQIGMGVTGASMGIAGIGSAFKSIFSNTARETAEIGRLAKDLGVSVQFVDRFQRLFKLAGGSAENAVDVIRTLNRTITGMQFGKVNDMLQMLGIAPKFTEDVEHNLLAIREVFNHLKPNQKDFLINEIGLDPETLRILRLTDKQYRELNKLASATGLVTDEQVKNAIEFQKSMALSAQSIQSIKRDMVGDVLPAFNNITRAMNKLLTDKSTKKILELPLNLMSSIFAGATNSLVNIKGGITSALDTATGKSKGKTLTEDEKIAKFNETLNGVFSNLIFSLTGMNVKTPLFYAPDAGKGVVNNINTTVNVASNANPADIGKQVGAHINDILRKNNDKYQGSER